MPISKPKLICCKRRCECIIEQSLANDTSSSPYLSRAGQPKWEAVVWPSAQQECERGSRVRKQVREVEDPLKQYGRFAELVKKMGGMKGLACQRSRHFKSLLPDLVLFFSHSLYCFNINYTTLTYLLFQFLDLEFFVVFFLEFLNHCWIMWDLAKLIGMRHEYYYTAGELHSNSSVNITLLLPVWLSHYSTWSESHTQIWCGYCGSHFAPI